MRKVKVSPLNKQSKYKSHNTPVLRFCPTDMQTNIMGLKAALPDVDLYYAVKAQPHPMILEAMKHLVYGFDVASIGELSAVKSFAPKTPTIHTHPVKTKQDFKQCVLEGCTTFVIDNLEELGKMRDVLDTLAVGDNWTPLNILIRINFRSPCAIVDLAKKFGCSISDVPTLVNALYDDPYFIAAGFSFHVGSQCTRGDAHANALSVSNMLAIQLGIQSPIIDIGGGFPAPYNNDVMPIYEFCEPIREVMTDIDSEVRVIAEPGRYIVASAVKSVAQIIGKAHRGDKIWYYLDDGVYGSYSGQIFDHQVNELEVFVDSTGSQLVYESVLAGPTCDSIDIIDADIELPELNIGDIIVGHCMGAYTNATANNFNGLKSVPMYEVKS